MTIRIDRPNVIDLFSGVGGLSLGAARAGFTVRGAVELDPFAARSHSLNFPNSVHLEEDIANLDGKQLLSACGLEQGQLDGLIGGPPCQGFSSIGRRCINDVRNNLFFDFFRLVSETKPQFFLAENVPGIMNKKYDELRAEAFGYVSENYIMLSPIRAAASEYGAPTSRTRYFFIGINKQAIARGVSISSADFAPCPNTPKIRVREALQGLPKNICASWISDTEGWRKVNMSGINRDSAFFSRVVGVIPPGVGHAISVERYLTKDLVSGCQGTRHSTEVALRYQNLEAGKTDPVSRSPRLDPYGFCPTLRAGTGSDRGSYQAVRPIHYKHGRVITPREAARLQGFPDWFRFHETKWHSFRQIGNSVSPIVAEAMLTTIYGALFAEQDAFGAEEHLVVAE